MVALHFSGLILGWNIISLLGVGFQDFSQWLPIHAYWWEVVVLGSLDYRYGTSLKEGSYLFGRRPSWWTLLHYCHLHTKVSDVPNKWVWLQDPSGVFFVSFAYRFLSEPSSASRLMWVPHFGILILSKFGRVLLLKGNCFLSETSFGSKADSDTPTKDCF